jgi:RimJ/RimL family protein N-acetyltransferase
MEKLPEEVLSRCSLPLKPDPVCLLGQKVCLHPLDLLRDSAVLYQRLNGSPITLGSRLYPEYDCDELVWKYMSFSPSKTLEEFQSNIQILLNLPDMRVFCIFDTETDSQVGVISIKKNAPQFLRAEIGSFFLSPVVQRTGASMEACYLLIDYLFRLGYRRVEWTTDTQNLRSINLAERIGFKFEVVFKYYIIYRDRNGDNVWFRILDYEWDEIKKELENKIYNH